MSSATPDSEPRVIDNTEVSFIPERLRNPFSNDLRPSTAATLVNEFANCPVCDSSLNVSASDGTMEDRDVVWRESRKRRTSTHTCSECNTELEILVEEKARPAIWSEIPDEQWTASKLWIRMDDGNYCVVDPNQIFITPLDKA